MQRDKSFKKKERIKSSENRKQSTFCSIKFEGRQELGMLPPASRGNIKCLWYMFVSQKRREHGGKGSKVSDEGLGGEGITLEAHATRIQRKRSLVAELTNHKEGAYHSRGCTSRGLCHSEPSASHYPKLSLTNLFLKKFTV